MTHPSLRHLDRTPYDEATRERVWAGIDRARRESGLPARRTRRPFGLAFAVCGGLAAAILAWPMHSLRHATPIPLARLVSPSEPTAALAGDAALSSASQPPSLAEISPTSSLPTALPAAPLTDPLRIDDRAARKVAGYVEARAPAVEELLREADRARATNRPSEAVSLFEQVARVHPSDSRAALAVLTAARIYLDTLHRPADAVRCFERALALGLPPGLADDARARSLEARSLASP